MISTSVMRGTFSIRVVPSASSDAAMSFRTEFLAPWTEISPRSRPAGRTVNCCIALTLPPLRGAVERLWPVCAVAGAFSGPIAQASRGVPGSRRRTRPPGRSRDGRGSASTGPSSVAAKTTRVHPRPWPPVRHRDKLPADALAAARRRRRVSGGPRPWRREPTPRPPRPAGRRRRRRARTVSRPPRPFPVRAAPRPVSPPPTPHVSGSRIVEPTKTSSRPPRPTVVPDPRATSAMTCQGWRGAASSCSQSTTVASDTGSLNPSSMVSAPAIRARSTRPPIVTCGTKGRPGRATPGTSGGWLSRRRRSAIRAVSPPTSR